MTSAERQAAELLLIPEMMRRVLYGALLTGHPHVDRARSNLAKAKIEATAHMDLPSTAVAHRTMDAIVGEAEHAAKFADRFGLAAYHFAKLVTDAGAIQIGQSSSLMRGLDIMLPALEPAAQNELLDEAARKQALRTLRLAQKRGLFPELLVEVRR